MVDQTTHPPKCHSFVVTILPVVVVVVVVVEVVVVVVVVVVVAVVVVVVVVAVVVAVEVMYSFGPLHGIEGPLEHTSALSFATKGQKVAWKGKKQQVRKASTRGKRSNRQTWKFED